MKRLNWSPPKVLAALLGLGSLIVFAGTLSDLRLYSDAFMDSVKIEVPTKIGRIKTQRFVASSQMNDLPAVQYIPFNSRNRDLINGRWEVRRIRVADGSVIYDKIGSFEDRNKFIDANLYLIGTSTVMMDNDVDQIFKISLMTDYDTIGLFKVMDDGYEIIEAKKLPRPKAKEVGNTTLANVNEEEKVNGLRLDGNVDLQLERALFPSKSSELLKGNKIRGDVSLVDGEIVGLRASIYYDERLPALEIDIPYAQIKDGGMFEAQIDNKSSHAMITNNGEGVFRVRFGTGPLQGAMLDFVTDEKMMQIQDEQYARTAEYERDDYTENYYSGRNTQVYNQDEVDQKQLEFENARAREEDEYARSNPDIDQRKMDQRVEESGYRF